MYASAIYRVRLISKSLIMKLTSTCVFILLLFSFTKLSAQTSANYTATTNQSSSLLVDKNGNAISFSGAANIISNNSIYNSTLLPMGFNFILMGKRYTHFVAGSDGQIGLGISTSSSDILYPLYSNALLRTVTYPPSINDAPVIAAFWDNLHTANTGSTVQYIVTGTQPNQCLAIQWNVAINNSSSTATNPSDGLFQMRLYETTGEIEFVYGKMNIGNSSSTVSASIGFTAGFTDNSFIALKDLTSFAFTRLAIEEPATRDLVNSAVPGPISWSKLYR